MVKHQIVVITLYVLLIKKLITFIRNFFYDVYIYFIVQTSKQTWHGQLKAAGNHITPIRGLNIW